MRLGFLGASIFFFSVYPLIHLLQPASLLCSFHRDWIAVSSIPLSLLNKMEFFCILNMDSKCINILISMVPSQNVAMFLWSNIQWLAKKKGAVKKIIILIFRYFTATDNTGFYEEHISRQQENHHRKGKKNLEENQIWVNSSHWDEELLPILKIHCVA